MGRWTLGIYCSEHALCSHTSCEYSSCVCPCRAAFLNGQLFSLTVEIGATIEPLAVGWHAIKRSGFKDGQSAFVVGAGPVRNLILAYDSEYESHTDTSFPKRLGSSSSKF